MEHLLPALYRGVGRHNGWEKEGNLPKSERTHILAAWCTRWQPRLEHTARKDEAASGQKAWDVLCGDQPRSLQPRLPTMLPTPCPQRGKGRGGLPKTHTSYRMLSVCLQCLCDLGKHGL